MTTTSASTDPDVGAGGAYELGYREGAEDATRRAGRTATAQRTCPSWCDWPTVLGWCNGDHITAMLGVSATAYARDTSAEAAGEGYPLITVYGSLNEHDGQPLSVCLHFLHGRYDVDADAELTIEQARELVENLQLILGQIGAANG